MPTLAERKAFLLDRALALSKRRQELALEVAQTEQDMMKVAGAIDIVDTLLADAALEHTDGK